MIFDKNYDTISAGEVVNIKHLLKFAMLPFLLFSNVSFASENIEETNISDSQKINSGKLSTDDKIKIGASGVLELVSKPFKGVGIVCCGIASTWSSIGLPSYLPDIAGTLSPPIVIGSIGLVFSVVGYALEYLSERVTPSEKIVAEKSQKKTIYNYKTMNISI